MRTFIGVSLLTGVLMLPGVATAASCPSSGVHVDQGSPAAKQYGFPVNNARGETSGSNCSGKHSSAGGAGSQLFGAGVSPHKTSNHTATTPKTTSTSTTSTTSTTATTAAAHKKPASHKKSKKKRAAVVSHNTSQPPPAKPLSASLVSHVTPSGAATNAGSSAWIALVGGGLLVLVLGTGAGLALKRRL